MSPDRDDRHAAPSRRWLRPSLLVLAIAALGVLAFVLPVTTWLVAVVEWIQAQGPAGPIAYALTYVAATVLLMPGSVLTLGAGFAYGPLWGLLLVSPVSVAAATASFLLGRTVARAWIKRRLASDPRFAAIDAAVGSSGFKIVLLLRLSPIFPFNLSNYALGLTKVRLRDYVLASWIGMLPATALFVYLGSLITSASELASGTRPDAGGAGDIMLAVGLAATLAVTVVLARIAKRALSRALEAETAVPKPGPGASE